MQSLSLSLSPCVIIRIYVYCLFEEDERGWSLYLKRSFRFHKSVPVEEERRGKAKASAEGEKDDDDEEEDEGEMADDEKKRESNEESTPSSVNKQRDSASKPLVMRRKGKKRGAKRPVNNAKPLAKVAKLDADVPDVVPPSTPPAAPLERSSPKLESTRLVLTTTCCFKMYNKIKYMRLYIKQDLDFFK